jgi:predicted house-cleaning noncanonical NTP pyrophosphatase (MazG superfamily)
MSKYDRPKGSVIEYNKLIRDKLPEIIKSFNRKPLTHVAEDTEYAEKLKAKLLEEVNEFLETDKEKELADILEVIHAICDSKKITIEDIEKIRKERAEKRGAFKQKLILEKVEY